MRTYGGNRLAIMSPAAGPSPGLTTALFSPQFLDFFCVFNPPYFIPSFERKSGFM
jgi:hypothetical protein